MNFDDNIHFFVVKLKTIMLKNTAKNWFIWGLSIMAAVFVNFSVILLQLTYGGFGGKNFIHRHRPGLQYRIPKSFEMPGLDIFIQIVCCLLLSVVVIYLFFRLKNRRKYKIFVIIFFVFLSFVVSLASINYFFLEIQTPLMIITVLFRGGMIIGIAYMICLYMLGNEKKNEILFENEQIKTENLQIQLNSLKNQLNPHFLFNSLNTLSWLINDDKAKSQRYLQKLSQVLRYSLNMQEQTWVSLTEELALVDDYVFLLKIRFDENLEVIKTVNHSEKYKIPPLSIQLLIENAIKHNIVSAQTPLKITIELNDSQKTVRVGNSVHKKLNSEGSGIGLVNLNERFRILSQREIKIEQNGTFSVTLPLS
jgi:sensor histidine kinase YesM